MITSCSFRHGPTQPRGHDSTDAGSDDRHDWRLFQAAAHRRQVPELRGAQPHHQAVRGHARFAALCCALRCYADMFAVLQRAKPTWNPQCRLSIWPCARYAQVQRVLKMAWLHQAATARPHPLAPPPPTYSPPPHTHYPDLLQGGPQQAVHDAAVGQEARAEPGAGHAHPVGAAAAVSGGKGGAGPGPQGSGRAVGMPRWVRRAVGSKVLHECALHLSPSSGSCVPGMAWLHGGALHG